MIVDSLPEAVAHSLLIFGLWQNQRTIVTPAVVQRGGERDTNGIDVVQRADDAFQLEAFKTPEIHCAIVPCTFDTSRRDVKIVGRGENRLGVRGTEHSLCALRLDRP